MTEQIIVDASWNVAAEGLDEIEVHIFYTAGNFLSQPNPFRRTAIKAVAEALGIEIVMVESFEGKSVRGVDDPFQWLDLRYGGGNYEITEEGEREAKFDKRLDYDKEKKDAFTKRVTGTDHFTAYGISAEGLTPTEYDLINLFADTCQRQVEFKECCAMHERAMFEVARRLGLKPVIVENSENA